MSATGTRRTPRPSTAPGALAHRFAGVLLASDCGCAGPGPRDLTSGHGAASSGLPQRSQEPCAAAPCPAKRPGGGARAGAGAGSSARCKVRPTPRARIITVAALMVKRERTCCHAEQASASRRSVRHNYPPPRRCKYVARGLAVGGTATQRPHRRSGWLKLAWRSDVLHANLCGGPGRGGVIDPPGACRTAVAPAAGRKEEARRGSASGAQQQEQHSRCFRPQGAGQTNKHTCTVHVCTAPQREPHLRVRGT